MRVIRYQTKRALHCKTVIMPASLALPLGFLVHPERSSTVTELPSKFHGQFTILLWELEIDYCGPV